MELDVTPIDGGAILRVDGDRIDAFAAVQFRDSVRDAAARTEGRVVLDLSGVRFLDSSGLGAVVSIWKTLAPDRALELAAMQDPVRRVFRLTKLDEVIGIHERLEDVLGERVDAD